ncbi:MAG: LysM peptidoglycan-binding domain-containing protein [Candidatus Dormibacteria bacterium]
MFHTSALLSDSTAASRYRRPRWRRDPRLLIGGVVLTCACVGGLATEVYGGSHAADRVVLVHPGDTVWGIAAAAYGDSDVRGRVDGILAANDIRGGTLVPGQRLTLPTP